MSWTVIIVLILVGLLFLLLEALVIPGTTIVGVIGFVLIAIGVWQSYAIHGAVVGNIVLLSTVLLSVVVLILALRSKTWKRIMLHTELDGKTNIVEEESVQVGDVGKTISRLAPMGKAFINNQYFEVTSTGGLIDQETEIRVVKIEGKKIFVKLNT